MSVIAVQRAETYDPDILRRAVGELFDALDVEKDLFPGMNVVIKPNLLFASRPEKTVTTHPAVIAAISAWLLDRGVTDITLADSPGGPYLPGTLRNVYNASGMNALPETVKLNFDTGWQTVQCPDGCESRSFNIINPLCKADYIINAAKLKTHGMTTMSAGIKNMFGSVPGLQKPELHYRYPDPDDFARMLLDVARTAAPQVTVIDAVEAMEGNGPSSGKTRHMGLLLASRDVLTQDWYAATLTGIGPERVSMLRQARELGWIHPDEIEVAGYVPPPADPPFALPDSIHEDLFGHVPVVGRALRFAAIHILRPVPEVDREECIGCGKCAEAVPCTL
jgi:uncharacterized protein (DUF362 family)